MRMNGVQEVGGSNPLAPTFLEELHIINPYFNFSKYLTSNQLVARLSDGTSRVAPEAGFYAQNTLFSNLFFFVLDFFYFRRNTGENYGYIRRLFELFTQCVKISITSCKQLCL
jgi:hypothetical protein